MADIQQEPSVETLLLRNDQAVDPSEEPEIIAPETTDPPVVESEPEVVEPEAAEARVEPDPEADPPEAPPEDDEGEDYTQEQWDALTDEQRATAQAEWDESQETEEDRAAQRQEAADKFKQDQLDFEKKKLDFEQKRTESKKEAEKLFQRRTEEFAEATRDLEVSEKWKHLKAKGREPAKEDTPATPFGEFKPRGMVTQAEAIKYKWTRSQMEEENLLRTQQNASGKIGHDKMVGIFAPMFQHYKKAEAREARLEMFRQRATDWGGTVKELAEELKYKIFTKDGKHTPEAEQIYEELGKVGVLEQNETTPEYRANMVRLIRNSVGVIPAGKTNGQLTIKKLPKAPPGQTLKTSSQKIPRRKRPPNTMGGSGTGSRRVQQERKNVEQIILGNE